jgi:hypothetical protein
LLFELDLDFWISGMALGVFVSAKISDICFSEWRHRLVHSDKAYAFDELGISQ